MLDDLKVIHERDAQDALGIAAEEWQQLTHQFEFQNQKPLSADYQNVVFAGMGGSALAGLIAASWPKVRVPFEVCRNYEIPAYVGSKTLFIASSYSGNTEETLEALSRAETKGASIAVIASGGRLIELANEKHYPLLQLPDIGQPRFAAFISFKAAVTLLVETNLTIEPNAVAILERSADFLRYKIQAWLPTVPTRDNQAKQLALELMGKSPVIYGGPNLFPAAYKWKISFNESAKNIAWCNQYPEFNHNEFMGWSSHPTEKPYGVIDLVSDLEHERIQKRFEISERLLSGKRPSPHVINAEGDTLIEQLVWTIALGDFVSLYLALLNGLNPTPVELIEKLKKELAS